MDDGTGLPPPPPAPPPPADGSGFAGTADLPPAPPSPAVARSAREALRGGLGKRALAIIIDGVIWMIIAFGVAGMIDQPAPASDSGYFGFYVTLGDSTIALTGVPMLIVVCAWLVYMTTMEWAVGATIGKFLVGVRVATREQGPMSLQQSAVRNLLRLIDSLPFFYVVGGILVKASETRLGDKAAKTDVYKRQAVPERKALTGGLLAGLVLSALMVAAVPVFFSDQEATGTPAAVDGEEALYSANGVSFSYPSHWKELETTEGLGSVGDAFFEDRLGTDADAGGVTISGYSLSAVVTEENVEQTRAEIEQVANQLAQDAGGELASPVSLTTVGGAPTWTFDIRFADWTSRQYMILSGDTEYSIACEWEGSDPDIEEGCALVTSSIEIDATS